MAANETVLGALHDAVTRALIEGVKERTLPAYMDPDTGVEVSGDTLPPSAAILTVAAKFLKDNNITCEPSVDNELGELERLMVEKQRNLRGTKVTGLDAADLASIRDDASHMGRA